MASSPTTITTSMTGTTGSGADCAPPPLPASAAPRVDTVYLRVKRQRPLYHSGDAQDDDKDDDATDRDRVVICCRDLGLGVPQQAASGRELLQEDERRMIRYAFSRIVRSSASIPSLNAVPMEPSDTHVGDSRHHEPAGALVTESSSATPAEATSKRCGNNADDWTAAFRELSVSQPPHHPSSKHNVKAFSTAEERVEASLQRGRHKNQTQRRTLRCQRIGALRKSTNVLCIDAAVATTSTASFPSPCDGLPIHGDFNHGDDELAVYDLYVLVSQSQSDGGDSGGDAEEDIFSVSGGGVGGEEDHDEMGFDEFDDEDDEFSFNVVCRPSRVQQMRHHHRRRRTAQRAAVMELTNVPTHNGWVYYDDVDGLMFSSVGGLLADDDRPEGVDNYVYFDHKDDDEYDSNAEDRPHCEYPDESDSGEDDDYYYDGGGGGGAVDDDDDSYTAARRRHPSCESDDGGGGGECQNLPPRRWDNEEDDAGASEGYYFYGY